MVRTIALGFGSTNLRLRIAHNNEPNLKLDIYFLHYTFQQVMRNHFLRISKRHNLLLELINMLNPKIPIFNR